MNEYEIILIETTSDPTITIAEGDSSSSSTSGGYSSSIGNIIYSGIAKQTISAFKAVIIKSDGVYICDRTSNHPWKYTLGLALNSALINETVHVLIFGYYQTSSIQFQQEGTLYLGDFGDVNYTIPNQGFIVRLGTALGDQSILWNPQYPGVLI